MRTDDPRPRASRADSAPGRLRDAARLSWGWLARRGPRARLALAGLGLAALIAAGYYAASPPTPDETAWLFDDRALAPDDARRVLAALAAAKVPTSPGPRGQVAVPAARKAEALALLAKQKLLPRTLQEIQGEAESASLLAWPVDRGERREQVHARQAEAMIAELEGIEAADVVLGRSSAHGSSLKPARVAALVRVQPREGRPLSPQTLQAIRSILKTTEPDLPPDALTVMDRAGHLYLEAGNPEAGAAMMAHARQEELRSEILRNLDWIDGVRAFVSLEPPAPPREHEPTEPSPSVVLNAPAAVADPEPPADPHPTPASPLGRARILIQVPIAHYRGALRGTLHHEPTIDELKPYVARVEETIRATIQGAIPSAEIASLKIDSIYTSAAEPPPVATSEPSSLRLPAWAAPAAGGAGVAVAVLVLIGTRWMAARRPAPEGTAIPRAHFDATSDSGPSGRVRDLVRRDPGAAAGVLGRWIGQGEAS